MSNTYEDAEAAAAAFAASLRSTMKGAADIFGSALVNSGTLPLGFAVVAIFPPLVEGHGPIGLVQQGSLAQMSASQKAELAFACAEALQLHGDLALLDSKRGIH